MQPCIKVLVSVLIIALQLFLLSYTGLLVSTFMNFKLMLLEKIPLPIEVTLSGIVTEVNPVQIRKTALPIEVTLFGIVIEVKPLQP